MCVGIPPGANGTACPSTSDPTINCQQRVYELTPTDCDPTRNDCFETQAYGGMPTFIDFVYDEVIPAVMTQMGLEAGEISSFGYSLGGLTACWAASTRPLQFQRGFCASPSVWWNYGGDPCVCLLSAMNE
jgi:predicted alpha/beta superfamily hydrolase